MKLRLPGLGDAARRIVKGACFPAWRRSWRISGRTTESPQPSVRSAPVRWTRLVSSIVSSWPSSV